VRFEAEVRSESLPRRSHGRSMNKTPISQAKLAFGR
jgi:hypothetical protein